MPLVEKIEWPKLVYMPGGPEFMTWDCGPGCQLPAPRENPVRWLTHSQPALCPFQGQGGW